MPVTGMIVDEKKINKKKNLMILLNIESVLKSTIHYY